MIEFGDMSIDITSWTGGLAWIAALVIIIAFFALTMLFVIGRKGGMTWIHGLFLVVLIALLVVTVVNYTSVLDWLYLGLTFQNIGAVIVLLGIGSMVGVMTYNYIDTSGDQIIR